MKKILIVLAAVLLGAAPAACTAGEIPEAALRLLEEHCYINPVGGSKLHADPNCPNVNPKYLPLTEMEFDGALPDGYSVCPVCTAVELPEEEPSPLDRATQVMPEEEIYRITAEWERQYGFSGLWDYRVNAAFAAENGTMPYNPYIFDPSLLPVFPDEDALPAEWVAENAASLAASYGSRLTEEDLKKCQVLVSQYVKPDTDVYQFSITGSWLVYFRSEEENVACLYVDAHTGVPDYFRIYPNGVAYIGAPGAEAVWD